MAAIALAEPEDGPGHGIVDWAEAQVRGDKRIHYSAHMALGKLFSLCTCTARISASQYWKAAYHRPRPTVTP